LNHDETRRTRGKRNKFRSDRGADGRHLLLGNREDHADRLHLRDDEKRCAGARGDEVPWIDKPETNAAVSPSLYLTAIS